MNKIIPYYHPTTVGFIDDNARFINSVADFAPNTITPKVFYTPEDALDWINAIKPRPPLAHECFSLHGNTVRFDVSALEEEIKRPERFERVSVFVVDYAMPTMNGVDFCAELADRDIRCLLLTGVADEKIAVAAFNRSLIHRYVPKANLHEMSDVFEHVQELERQYFAEYGQSIALSLATNRADFEWMRQIEQFLHDTQRSLNAVEYYLLDNPRGYLFLDRYGQATRMVVLSQEEIEHELQRCLTLGAPQEFREEAYAQTKLPYLMEDPRDYRGRDEFPWAEALHPYPVIEGWCIAVVANPPVDVDFDPDVSSYDAYLSRLDGASG